MTFWRRRPRGIGDVIADNLLSYPEQWERGGSVSGYLGTPYVNAALGWTVVEDNSFYCGHTIHVVDIPTTSGENRLLARALDAWRERRKRMKREDALRKYCCAAASPTDARSGETPKSGSTRRAKAGKDAQNQSGNQSHV